MFSINIYLRLGLIILCLGGGVVLTSLYGFWYAFPFFLTGIILLVGYILFGTVQSAAKMMQTMDIAGAEKRMKLTVSPRLLYSANRAYFYMLKGTIAQHKKDTDESEFYFQKAKETKLPTDNEKAMVNIQLANMQANRGNWTMAKQLYREVKGMQVTEPQIKEQVEEFGKVIKNSGNIKAAQSGRFRGAMNQQSKKRRRPRMR
ncbi:hypothetical protein KUV50_04555 [Membranicola marinus]|uniref:Tetratricopeptide repeat-containing protein n=1 Tax=Membranihabitans marinus TaxID=1227546 RepID=A0A953HSE4_9BACT|nr:hypothetical protein [Membranihabitans marinus]MBY5957396.1 hypothetical protein [Membranihabitans marinus]